MRVVAARGALAAFNEAGVLEAADVHVARRLGRLGGESSEAVLLAAALVVRAVRSGSVCVELDRLREVSVEDVDVTALPWPDDVVAALRASALVAGPGLTPLRLIDTDGGPLLYLDRYYRQERTVAEILDARAASAPPLDVDAVRAGLTTAFGSASEPDRQRLAAAVAVTRWTTVITGGPGTGKTYTVARLIAVLRGLDPDLRIALAAPTGKAAARLAEEAAAQGWDLPATTLHRLLGWRPDSKSRFRHDAQNRLPYDVVIVDECSMVSLTMMSRLVEAVRPQARLVFVGDADQLTSVDAGAVLADLVARPAVGPAVGPGATVTRLVPADLVGADLDELAAGVVRLDRGHRFGGGIADLADAVRAGDDDAVLDLLRSGSPDVSFHSPSELAALAADVAGSGRAVVAAATAGDVDGALAALAEHRLLCAHRHGPFGVSAWDRWARALVTGPDGDQRGWYPGQPLLVTANDYDVGVWNGDTGVVLADGDSVIAAFARPRGPIRLHPSRLAEVQTVYAMTIHRAQGSQYRRVSVVLPAEASALLSRELLYTAVTRAREHVRVIGTEASVRAAVQRQVLRASGLRRRTTS